MVVRKISQCTAILMISNVIRQLSEHRMSMACNENKIHLRSEYNDGKNSSHSSSSNNNNISSAVTANRESLSMCNIFIFASEMKINLKIKMNAGKVLLLCTMCVGKRKPLYWNSLCLCVYLFVVHVVHSYVRITWLVGCLANFHFKEAFHVKSICSHIW